MGLALINQLNQLVVLVVVVIVVVVAVDLEATVSGSLEHSGVDVVFDGGGSIVLHCGLISLN